MNTETEKLSTLRAAAPAVTIPDIDNGNVRKRAAEIQILIFVIHYILNSKSRLKFILYFYKNQEPPNNHK